MAIKPTQGAMRRFERLPAMLDARCAFPGWAGTDGEPDAVDGTVVDISTGCMCMRVPMDGRALEIMGKVQEGCFVEVDIAQAPERRWTIMGRIAWVWVPTMDPDDRVGSLGVDIQAVAEENDTWWGKVARLFRRESEVEVERTSRIVPTRSLAPPPARKPAAGDAPKQEEPKAEKTKAEAKAEAKAEKTKAEAPKAEEPKAEAKGQEPEQAPATEPKPSPSADDEENAGSGKEGSEGEAKE